MKGYTFRNYNQEHMARALGMALPVSFKQSVEICRFIKNKNINDAKEMLQSVVRGKTAIPFKRFDFDLGHKKKIGPGRYPQKASGEFIRLIENVESNAQFKGLNTSNLVIAHVSAHKSGKTWHFGRKSRRRMKRTNVEIIVEETATDIKEEAKTKAMKKVKK
ncbi:50S ribosomal protein L22 [Candidatus Woesearchaeota archaeon]|nr:50S ribosomal protein L22 [Candidatus Woesearchaeota archaeon]